MKSYPTGTNYLEVEGSLHNAINGSTIVMTKGLFAGRFRLSANFSS